ncbi:TTC12 protein, partial [Polyodon spathula]|nr:TTC12 protein [Polyodon spathula]
MKLLEKDALERSERRKENELLAKALKEMGNEAFAKGDYETAVQRYSEGLEKLRDMQVLYTNRAQAYIKLEKYKEAVNDCEWALKVSTVYLYN